MASKVAIIEFDGDIRSSLKQALKLIGNIDDLNTKERSVVIKVGVFSARANATKKPDISLVKTKSN